MPNYLWGKVQEVFSIPPRATPSSETATIVGEWAELGTMPSDVTGIAIEVAGEQVSEDGWRIEIATRFMYIPTIVATIVLNAPMITAETLGVLPMTLPSGERLFARITNLSTEAEAIAPVVTLVGVVAAE